MASSLNNVLQIIISISRLSDFKIERKDGSQIKTSIFFFFFVSRPGFWSMREGGYLYWEQMIESIILRWRWSRGPASDKSSLWSNVSWAVAVTQGVELVLIQPLQPPFNPFTQCKGPKSANAANLSWLQKEEKEEAWTAGVLLQRATTPRGGKLRSKIVFS